HEVLDHVVVAAITPGSFSSESNKPRAERAAIARSSSSAIARHHDVRGFGRGVQNGLKPRPIVARECALQFKLRFAEIQCGEAGTGGAACVRYVNDIMLVLALRNGEKYRKYCRD